MAGTGGKRQRRVSVVGPLIAAPQLPAVMRPAPRAVDPAAVSSARCGLVLEPFPLKEKRGKLAAPQAVTREGGLNPRGLAI